MRSADRLLGRAYLALVFLFLYVPTASVVVYSFNESQLVTVWSGRVVCGGQVIDRKRIRWRRSSKDLDTKCRRRLQLLEN